MTGPGSAASLGLKKIAWLRGRQAKPLASSPTTVIKIIFFRLIICLSHLLMDGWPTVDELSESGNRTLFRRRQVAPEHRSESYNFNGSLTRVRTGLNGRRFS